MSEQTYREFVADLVAGTDRPKSEVCDEIIGFVDHGYASGEQWAMQVLNRWARAGANTDYTEAHKSLNSVTYVRKDGRRVRKTTSYSRPERSPESGEIVAQQMRVFWDLTRDELVMLRDDLDRQVGQIADSRTVVEEVLAALDRHPECSTAREAWLADGRSLDEINLEEKGLAS